MFSHVRECVGPRQMAVQAKDLEHWFSSKSQDGNCRELLDVFMVPLRDGFMSPEIRLPDGEER